MKKVRILGIAPYEGIKSLMFQESAKRNDVDVTLFTGNLEAGAAIASRYHSENFDIIISRGGTAELIRQQSVLSVVDIQLSVYDIFRSIKLAENLTGKYALIGFPAITKNAHFLCDMLQYSIDIYTIHNQQEAAEVLEMLAKKGFRIVLCDMITKSLAQKYGLTSILITSGAESINAAFDAAVQLSRAQSQAKAESAFYRCILEEHPWPTAVFDSSGELLFCTRNEELSDRVMEKMQANLSSVMDTKEKRIYYESSNSLYILYGYCKVFENHTRIVFHINRRKVPLSLKHNGIYYITRQEANNFLYSNFYGITHSMGVGGVPIMQYVESSSHLVILGESGTGKNALAHLIYAKSEAQNKPLVIIDCVKIRSKGWEFLTQHDASPLSDSDKIIYIKNVSALSENQFVELLDLLSAFNRTMEHRLIFTFRYESDNIVSSRCRKIMDVFSCLEIRIDALRTRLMDIPDLASVYISTLNMQLAKNIIGIEPDGIHLLQSYNWPGNYEQFQRVLKELVFSSKTAYIKASDVQLLLQREAPTSSLQTGLNLNRTLEEINLDICKQVLSEENGNQTAAAKRLDIGRTTLWRMLQKSDE